jgi:AsmA protein
VAIITEFCSGFCSRFSRVPKAIGFKRFGLVVAAAVVAGVGFIALSTSLISGDAARDAVKAQIKAATGLDPVVRGGTAISIFPPDTITLGDVVLGDNPNQPALSAQVLTARLRLLPLLMGRIEIADVVLVHPRISVRTERDGQTNWSTLLETLARATKPNAERGALSFSEIHISDGSVTIDDAARDIRETLHHVELSLAWPSISKSFAATGQFAWRSENVETSLAIGDFYAALTGDPSSLKFRMSSLPLKVAFDGTMSNKPTMRIDGMLAADTPRLRDTLRWTTGNAPPGGGFNRFALKSQLKASGGTFALSGVNIELDGNAAEGVLSYSMAERNLLQGTLAAGNTDLTPYISTFQFIAGNAREWNRKPFAIDHLNAFDIDLRMSAAQLTIAGAKVGRTAVATNLRNGKLAITIGESQAYGGLITGSFALAKGSNGVDAKSQMLFANVDLENCLAQIFGMKRVEGKGNLTYAVEASGDSVDALARTLNGTANLTATDGSLSGINIEQLLRRLERRPLSGAGDFRSGRTPFDRLAIPLKIVNGIATADDTRMDGPAVRLTINGTASVPARDMNLKGTATLIGSSSEPGFDLPFIVQGNWDEPLMLPDPQILIRRSGAAAPLLDAVRDRKARDAVRSAIDRLTGGGSTPAPASTP